MRAPSLTNCKHCGVEFSPNPWAWSQGKARFCSKPCGNKGRYGTLEDRFWRNVRKSRGCWNFQKLGNWGYGRLSEDRHQIGAHRYSWELHFGPVPDGLLVCHKCDNKACVRPDHLFIGTPLDNTRDMDIKGRRILGSRATASKGAAHYHTTLKEADIRKIRRMHAKGDLNNKQIADIYGVGRMCISHIVRRTSWAHIP